MGLPPGRPDRDPLFVSEPVRRGANERAGHGPRARRLPGAARLWSAWSSRRRRRSTARPERVPIDEKHPLQGQSPYAATKIAADALGESYHRAFGLPVAILRPFNTFGPRQSARAIIPTIISQALLAPTVKLGRLDPRRDLTYVKDTVAGFVAIAGCDAAVGRVVNIGRGEDISIGELVETDRPAAGPPIRVESDEHASAGRQRSRAAARRHRAWRRASGAGSPAIRSKRGSTRRSTGSATHIDRFRVDSYVT